jgi:hypothetical protein
VREAFLGGFRSKSIHDEVGDGKKKKYHLLRQLVCTGLENVNVWKYNPSEGQRRKVYQKEKDLLWACPDRQAQEGGEQR